jgi:hypothetical protein
MSTRNPRKDKKSVIQETETKRMPARMVGPTPISETTGFPQEQDVLAQLFSFHRWHVGGMV